MPEEKISAPSSREEIAASGAFLGAGRLPLVGRGHEKDQLLSAIRGAISGEGALMLLAGEPGVGKTRQKRSPGKPLGSE